MAQLNPPGSGRAKSVRQQADQPLVSNLLHVLSACVFVFFLVCLLLFFFLPSSQTETGQHSGPNKWEESCFTAFNCTLVPTDMTFEDGEDNDINKDRQHH